MLQGTAAIDTLAGNAATIDAWSSEPASLVGVTCVQIIAELRRADRAALLPAGLHPTDPPSIALLGWRVDESPWGPFSWVSSRLSCRSGVRARGLTTAAVVDSVSAAEGLAVRYGFPTRVGDVRIERHYDGVDVSVDDGGLPILRAVGVDARPLGLNDVQYNGTMNLANTPNGLRLVQVEADYDPLQVERMKGRIEHFDGAAWGSATLDPYFVVAATVARERSITLPPVRFVCRPEESALHATERIM